MCAGLGCSNSISQGIARLKVNRAEFDQQAIMLMETNVVYKQAENLPAFKTVGP